MTLAPVKARREPVVPSATQPTLLQLFDVTDTVLPVGVGVAEVVVVVMVVVVVVVAVDVEEVY